MSKDKQMIHPTPPRADVHAHIGDDLILSGKPGTTLESFFISAQDQNLLQLPASLVAAICDGELRELTHPATKDVTLRPVTLAESDGSRIYRRSLVLLLAAAIHTIWPQTKIKVKFAVRDGGFYCSPVDRPAFTPQELTRLDAQMRKMVAEDYPIIRDIIPLKDAMARYLDWGDKDKVRLLQFRTLDYLTVYRLNDYEDYYFGYMVPSTRYLQTFRLIDVGKAFVLQYPRRESPTQLHNLQVYDKLHTIFRQSDDLLTQLKIPDMGRLNEIIASDHIQELILVAEAMHERRVAEIATEIHTRYTQGARIVLIAGPSSSGKTTFSKRLAIQLIAHGLNPFTVEMDNYFVNREKTPRDENGDYDFESIEALDRNQLNSDLLRLLNGENVQLPRFNFHTGKREAGRLVQIGAEQVIILEGIHGMNPHLLDQIPQERIYRIYVSALTQLNIDRHNRVPTTDVRLIRRIVRDAQNRGYSALDTLNRWGSVRRGEKRNIFPYQENADIMFDSALIYELAALRPVAEPLLLQVPQRTAAGIEAKRLLSLLRWLKPLDRSQIALIPETSLLREFIGGSMLDRYHPGTDTFLSSFS